MDLESYLMRGNRLLFNAIINNKLEDIKLLLNELTDINVSILKIGPLAGCTALHIACMMDKAEVVELLVKNYNADVNVTANDAMQPIHFACFFNRQISSDQKSAQVLKILLESKANANADFGKDIFIKYGQDVNKKWCPDFGDRIALIIYTIIYKNEDLFYPLLKFGAKIDIVSRTNKTLLMYAIERDLSYIASSIAHSMEGSKLLNYCDNDGRSALHYILHPKKYGEFRYDAGQQFGNWADDRLPLIREIREYGGDIHALVNNDPATFLPNMAAYRADDAILIALLPHYRSIPLSRALYYATLPVDENSPTYLRVPEGFDPFINPTEELLHLRKGCIRWILEDLVSRRTFGLPVPEEEDKLMKKLMATDSEIRRMVEYFEKNCIEKELKNKFIEIGGKKMTRYEFIMQVWSNKKLKLLVRDKNLVDTWEEIFDENVPDYDYFVDAIRCRIDNARMRYKLMEEVKMIKQLRTAIPLPFELIWEIVDYMSNNDLKIFIEAFESN